MSLLFVIISDIYIYRCYTSVVSFTVIFHKILFTWIKTPLWRPGVLGQNCMYCIWDFMTSVKLFSCKLCILLNTVHFSRDTVKTVNLIAVQSTWLLSCDIHANKCHITCTLEVWKTHTFGISIHYLPIQCATLRSCDDNWHLLIHEHAHCYAVFSWKKLSPLLAATLSTFMWNDMLKIIPNTLTINPENSSKSMHSFWVYSDTKITAQLHKFLCRRC